MWLLIQPRLWTFVRLSCGPQAPKALRHEQREPENPDARNPKTSHASMPSLYELCNHIDPTQDPLDGTLEPTS